jgi:hypothetical protein
VLHVAFEPRGGDVKEPLYARSEEVKSEREFPKEIASYLVESAGFAKTANESGSVALVMMARTRMPKRRFVRNGDTIWPTAVPSGSARRKR